MGAVYVGRDLRLGRAVAVKVMQPEYARDAEYSKRFLREAQATSMVRHRNVVVVLDYGEAKGGRVYLVMELLVGQDLEQFLRGQPEQRIAWSDACGLLVQIASGLRAAHEQGVIHRDVKPANCLLTIEDDESVVKVVDFGIAKLEAGMQTQQLTGTGSVLGTPSYTEAAADGGGVGEGGAGNRCARIPLGRQPSAELHARRHGRRRRRLRHGLDVGGGEQTTGRLAVRGA